MVWKMFLEFNHTIILKYISILIHGSIKHKRPPRTGWRHNYLIDLHKPCSGVTTSTAGAVSAFCVDRFNYEYHILEKETFKHKDLNCGNITYISFFRITIFLIEMIKSLTSLVDLTRGVMSS